MYARIAEYLAFRCHTIGIAAAIVVFHLSALVSIQISYITGFLLFKSSHTTNYLVFAFPNFL